jgi:hypothetical protein
MGRDEGEGWKYRVSAVDSIASLGCSPVTNGDERVDDAGHAPGKASLAYFNTFWTPLFGSLAVSARRRPGAEKFDKSWG